MNKDEGSEVKYLVNMTNPTIGSGCSLPLLDSSSSSAQGHIDEKAAAN